MLSKSLFATVISGALALSASSSEEALSSAPDWYLNHKQNGSCFVVSGVGDSKKEAEAMSAIKFFGTAAMYISGDVSNIKLSSRSDVLEDTQYLKILRKSAFTDKIEDGREIKRETVKSGDKFISYVKFELVPGDCSSH